MAGVSVHSIFTRSAMLTRITNTFVDVRLANSTCTVGKGLAIYHLLPCSPTQRLSVPQIQKTQHRSYGQRISPGKCGHSLHQYTNSIMSRVWCIPLYCCQICIRLESLPLNPGGHWPVNAFTWSTHVPPCWHGSQAHSLTFVSHLEPAKLKGELKPQHGGNDYSSCRRLINCNKQLILVELLQLNNTSYLGCAYLSAV